MDWGFDTLIVLLGLLLVLEGILPAIFPETWRNILKKLSSYNDNIVRSMGVSSMVIGAIIITLVHNWDLLPSIDSSMLENLL